MLFSVFRVEALLIARATLNRMGILSKTNHIKAWNLYGFRPDRDVFIFDY